MEGKRGSYHELSKGERLMLQPLSDEHYMKLALGEAQQAFEAGEIPIGAVLVADSGRVIAKGYNQTELLSDATAHAEMLAITAGEDYLGSKYLDECTLYVTLEPCTMCAGAIFWTQLKKLVYGANDPKRGFTVCTNSLFPKNIEVRSGVLATECGALIDSFFEQLRKNKI